MATAGPVAAAGLVATAGPVAAAGLVATAGPVADASPVAAGSWPEPIRWHPTRTRSETLSSHVPPSPRLPGPFVAVVFDMDGLLVHTERQWLQAKMALFENHHSELTRADRAAVFGVADLESVTYFARRFGLPEARITDLQDEYIEIIGQLIDDGIELTDGAAELITYLRTRIPLALASNTRRPLVDRILRQTPFASAFGAIATGDEVPPKPAPDVYRLACRRLGVEPTRAVAIEDSPTGVRAAQAAGLTCIGVPSDTDHPLPEADHLVGSLRELLQVEG